MAAPNGYPSWVYNRTEPAVVVNSLAAFEALSGTWGPTPSPGNPSIRPLPPPPGTLLEALLAILLLLTQRLPEPPVVLSLVAPTEPPDTHETGETHEAHKRHQAHDAEAEPEPEPNHKARSKRTYPGD